MESNNDARWTSSPVRLCSLTDGVYAIVLTLLVLDLKPPQDANLSNDALMDDVLQQFPTFLAYIASFTVVAQIWQRHHRLFTHQRECDLTIVSLNFLHIFLVTLIPYTASLVGHYDNDRFAVILFNVDLATGGGSLVLIARRMASRPDLREPGKPPPLLKYPWAARHVYGISGALSVLISFISLHFSLLVWIFGAVIMVKAKRQ
ncbi:hypothetical protein CA54_23340 [Symmachiella macrocystis]|uniref:DUF1211 domain-containing protein n=1 Tax=Symmachiella macrocystis TaxID=2527985 RepID=A0A5C6BRG8_9PLAN|nr:TMEM175 family protein [Symmachiella macrocystis]TWU13499.1 hypothetical protein CA54_23340 [Symmachiella macrocystis]